MTGKLKYYLRTNTDIDDKQIDRIISCFKFRTVKKKTILLSLGGNLNKVKFLETAQTFLGLGYKIFATDTTAEFLKKQNVECEVVRKAFEASPNALDIIERKKVAFVVNLSIEGHTPKQQITDGFRLRRATVDNQIPLFTDLHLARAFIKALARYNIKDLEIKSYKEYLN